MYPIIPISLSRSVNTVFRTHFVTQENHQPFGWSINLNRHLMLYTAVSIVCFLLQHHSAAAALVRKAVAEAESRVTIVDRNSLSLCIRSECFLLTDCLSTLWHQYPRSLAGFWSQAWIFPHPYYMGCSFPTPAGSLRLIFHSREGLGGNWLLLTVMGWSYEDQRKRGDWSLATSIPFFGTLPCLAKFASCMLLDGPAV